MFEKSRKFSGFSGSVGLSRHLHSSYSPLISHMNPLVGFFNFFNSTPEVNEKHFFSLLVVMRDGSIKLSDQTIS